MEQKNAFVVMSAQFLPSANQRKQREGPVLSELTPLLLCLRLSLGLRAEFSELGSRGSVRAVASFGRAVVESDELADSPAVLGSHCQELLQARRLIGSVDHEVADGTGVHQDHHATVSGGRVAVAASNDKLALVDA